MPHHEKEYKELKKVLKAKRNIKNKIKPYLHLIPDWVAPNKNIKVKRIYLILNTRNSSAIDKILPRLIQILKKASNEKTKNKVISEILKSRYSLAIETFLDDLYEWVENAPNEPTRDDRISQILKTRKACAIKIVLPELQTWIDNALNKSIQDKRISQILIARNAPALKIILSYLSTWVKNSSNNTVKNKRIHKILSTKSSSAIETIFDSLVDWICPNGIVDKNRHDKALKSLRKKTLKDLLNNELEKRQTQMKSVSKQLSSNIPDIAAASTLSPKPSTLSNSPGTFFQAAENSNSTKRKKTDNNQVNANRKRRKTSEVNSQQMPRSETPPISNPDFCLSTEKNCFFVPDNAPLQEIPQAENKNLDDVFGNLANFDIFPKDSDTDEDWIWDWDKTIYFKSHHDH